MTSLPVDKNITASQPTDKNISFDYLIASAFMENLSYMIWPLG